MSGEESPAPRVLLLDNIGQLLTLDTGWDDAAGLRRGAAMRELAIVKGAAVLCVDGKIAAYGARDEVAAKLDKVARAREAIRFDCQNGVALPGFCDSHTHPVFVEPRLVDFEKRIAGASYEEIAAAGGGIRSSIASVRAASESDLEAQIEFALHRMAMEGTTTVEAKSGYGLTVESELKSLRAIRRVAERWKGGVVATLLGAHIVPPEFAGRRDEYVRIVCEQMIPQAASEELAQFVDVFCERGAFTEDETESIFDAAVAYGLQTRAHVCQFTRGELERFERSHPASFDHLDCVDEAGIRWLSKARVIATLVPGANFFLGQTAYPPARALIDGGAAVALATDFNPGTAPITSMPFVLSLACTQMKMTVEEALVAATINGAHALRLATHTGSIAIGKHADIGVFGVDDYREIPYWVAGANCLATVIGGELVM